VETVKYLISHRIEVLCFFWHLPSTVYLKACVTVITVRLFENMVLVKTDSRCPTDEGVTGVRPRRGGWGNLNANDVTSRILVSMRAR